MSLGGGGLSGAFPAREVAYAVGANPVEWAAVASGGYGRVSAHWRVSLADGRSVFVKHALTQDAAEWLRRERLVYESVVGAFMPEYLGSFDEDGTMVLALQDLSGAECRRRGLHHGSTPCSRRSRSSMRRGRRPE